MMSLSTAARAQFLPTSGAADYATPANWTGGVITGQFTNALSASLAATFAADYVQGAGEAGLYFDASGGGSVFLTLRSVDATPRLLTLDGGFLSPSNVGVPIIIGTTANPLNLDLGSATRSFNIGNAAGSITVTNTIGSAGGMFGIVKTGAGSLTLGGANTFTGGSSLVAGTVILGSNTALGAGGTVTLGGATVQASADVTLANPLTLAASTTISGTNSLGFSGPLTVTGASRQITNGIDVAGKSLSLGNVFLSDAAATGRTLTINCTGAGATTLNGMIADFNGSGSPGAVVYAGTNTAGNVAIYGTNTYTGGTTISLSTTYSNPMLMGTDTAFGTGPINVPAGVIVNLQPVGGTRTIANPINLTGTLRLLGNGNNIVVTGPITVTVPTGEALLALQRPAGAIATLTGSTITLGNPVSNGGDGIGKRIDFFVDNDQTVIINDVIRDVPGTAPANSGSVVYSTAGTAQVNAANTYTGGTTISYTTIQLGVSTSGTPLTAGPFGTGTVSITGTVSQTGPNFQPIAADRIIANPISLGFFTRVSDAAGNDFGLSFTGPITLSSRSSTLTNSITASGKTLSLANIFLSDTSSTGYTLTIGGTGTTVVNGVIANFNGAGTAGGFAVSGGTVRLLATNTYTGPTTVSGGSLVLSGSASFAASPTVIVGSAGPGPVLDVSGVTGGANFSGGSFALATGQTIEGFGTVFGSARVPSGTFVAPGTSVGILYFNNDLGLDGTYLTDVAGATADKLAVSGNLTISSNAVLDLLLTNNYDHSTPLTIATFASLTGAFSPANVQNLPANYSIVYTPTSIVLMPVPEPGTFALLAAGLFAAWRGCRRHSRDATFANDRDNLPVG